MSKGAEVRETGSGGTGATNVSRKAGKAAGVLTLVLDLFKGVAAVVVARLILSGMDDQWIGDPSRLQQIDFWWIAVAALVAIVGHMFPVWLNFRGGKGVATGVGVFLVLAPMAVAVAAVLFFLIVWRTRYVSLGSIVAALSIPLFVLLQGVFVSTPDPPGPVLMATSIGAALIVF